MRTKQRKVIATCYKHCIETYVTFILYKYIRVQSRVWKIQYLCPNGSDGSNRHMIDPLMSVFLSPVE